ncbi:MAG: ribosome small subunit-dependent GTPase A [Bacteroidales bacterium]|nr:ribosome small subunit-dependent GTPase A [Bacteroidales bacterium]
MDGPSSTGTVIKSVGSQYTVRTDDGRTLLCALKGKFRLQGMRTTNPVAVGDRVRVEGTDGMTAITEILDRRNYIIRRAANLSREAHIIAANIDLAFLVVTLRLPEIKPPFIDRFLASAESYRVPVCLVFNKMDIYTAEETAQVEAWCRLYERIGYEVLTTSVPQRLHIDRMAEMMRGKVTMLSGNSGVGKSSLINAVQPGAALRSGEVSAATLSGRHTTTHAEMIPTDDGGYIIDTPGVRGFGLFRTEREEVYHFFPEIFRAAAGCRYHNCLHVNEPGCAVKEAVQSGDIAESRYISYLGILEDDGKYR